MRTECGYCRDCKWWAESDLCELTLSQTESNFCELTVSQDGSTVHSASMAVAKDAEDYYACLVTKPDFGCVQWESKE